MHIDWSWIKQRPQFLAEGLANKFKLNVIFPKLKKSQSYKHANISNSTKSDMKFSTTFQLPLRGRVKLIGFLNECLNHALFRINIAVFRPDFIWITYPPYSKYVPRSHSYKIIYDCMDDAENFFTKNLSMRKLVAKQEMELLNKSDAVIVSSQSLYELINRKLPISNKLHLVRNAFGGDVINLPDVAEKVSGSFKIGYIGTISGWFDFEVLEHCTKNIDNLEFHLIGPSEVNIPQNMKNIVFHGPVNHSELFDKIQKYDCLIMPFKINDLILSVDPVKLYEYINFNKPIISISYPEIQRFTDFVHFYTEKDSLLSLIENMVNNPTKLNKKYTSIDRKKFLKANDWNSRLVKIQEVLCNLSTE